MLRGPKRERRHFGPIGYDYAKSRGPEPRLTHKDINNPPIVTIFGAGIAGLTAAHELVDRGFLVQVVESKRDAYARGRPLVGGMAATQYARVRANVEDLHPDLLSGKADMGKDLTQWLLRLLGFNRSWWLQTERPVEIHGCLYDSPRADARDGRTIGESVLATLVKARERYRANWIWDLVMRSVLIETVRSETTKEELVALAATQCEKVLESSSAYAVAQTIFAYERAFALKTRSTPPTPLEGGERSYKEPSLPPIPDPEEFERAGAIIDECIEREFLCFRLRPYACDDDPANVVKARELLDVWQKFFEGTEVGKNLWPTAQPARVERVAVPPRTAEAEAPRAWLEVEIIEKRLPGEHGFRFFPSYYRHLDDTMKRVPLYDCECESYRTVYDNLRPTTVQQIGISRADRLQNLPGYARSDDRLTDDQRKAVNRAIDVRRDRPSSFEGMRDRTDRFLEKLGCAPKDGMLFAARMLRFMTSCPERRRRQYEEMGWAEFIGTEGDDALPYSEPMKAQIEASAQCVLALSAAEADARTYGDATVQLFMDMLGDGTRTDRTLNGPSSDAFLEPWREHLERQGVRFFLGKLERLELDEDGELVPIVTRKRPFSQDGHEWLDYEAVEGRRPDFYVLALDLPAVERLLRTLELDPRRAGDLEQVPRFHAAVTKHEAFKDMSGVQFFFDSKASIGKGHMYFPYSEWGLSSISQSEFWSRRGGFADGYFGVLSVDVSRMTPGDGDLGVKNALAIGSELPREVGDRLGRWWAARKVWEQLKDRIDVKDGLPEPRVFHVDDNIQMDGNRLTNATPYLATLPGTWKDRPGLSSDGEIAYSLGYDRWVLCGTYMATYTRMTSMESANESARHAVTTILSALRHGKALAPRGLLIEGVDVWAEVGPTEKYNGASRRRGYDDPDMWNPEAEELADLEVFRRLDASLLELGLDHWMDICDFDRKFVALLELVEPAGGTDTDKLLEFAVAGLRTSLTQAIGVAHPLAPSVQKLITLVRRFVGLP